jgi:drug/metabolite transporter (DMT)-like permease
LWFTVGFSGSFTRRVSMWSQQQRLAASALLGLSFTYGIAGIVARELQKELGTWQQVALQNWGGFLLAWVMLWVTQGRFTPSSVGFRGGMELMGRAVLGRVLGSVLYIQACLHAPLGNVGWLSALPTSVLFAWLVWGEQTSKREVYYLLLGLVGVGLVVAPSGSTISSLGYGELCALGATLLGGLAALLGRDSVKETDTWSATVWVTFTTATTATLMACVIDGGLALPSVGNLPALATVIAIVFASSAGGLFGYAHLSTSVASAILSLEAVWAIGIGYLIYGEVPTALAALGGGMIVWSAYAIKLPYSINTPLEECECGS